MTEEDLRFYLQQTEDILGKENGQPPLGQGVHSMPGLVLKYGVMLTGSPLPAGIQRRRKGMCYANALALAQEEDWLYVEGYAESVFPLPHAWCIDDQGRVVDPTWDEEEDRLYFGIPMDPNFVLHLVTEQDTYAILGEVDEHKIIDRGFVTDVCERTGLTIAVELG